MQQSRSRFLQLRGAAVLLQRRARERWAAWDSWRQEQEKERQEQEREQQEAARAREVQKYFRNSRAVAEQGLEQMVNLVNFNIITIVPHMIRYLDLRKGFRNVVWEKEQQAR